MLCVIFPNHLMSRYLLDNVIISCCICFLPNEAECTMLTCFLSDILSQYKLVSCGTVSILTFNFYINYTRDSSASPAESGTFTWRTDQIRACHVS